MALLGRVTGRHSGEFFGVPSTGRRIDVACGFFYRFEGRPDRPRAAHPRLHRAARPGWRAARASRRAASDDRLAYSRVLRPAAARGSCTMKRAPWPRPRSRREPCRRALRPASARSPGRARARCRSASASCRPARTARRPAADRPDRCRGRCRSPRLHTVAGVPTTSTPTCPPSGVNFTAFDSRFEMICCSRSASPCDHDRRDRRRANVTAMRRVAADGSIGFDRGADDRRDRHRRRRAPPPGRWRTARRRAGRR